MKDAKYLPIPDGWWKGIEKYRIDLHAKAWHENECIRLWNEHGPAKFYGLDFRGFGFPNAPAASATDR